MSNRHKYLAFVVTMGALVTMFALACLLAYNGRSVEAIGISGALTGLIALAGTLAGGRQQMDEVTIKQPANEPIPVEEAKS